MRRYVSLRPSSTPQPEWRGWRKAGCVISSDDPRRRRSAQSTDATTSSSGSMSWIESRNVAASKRPPRGRPPTAADERRRRGSARRAALRGAASPRRSAFAEASTTVTRAPASTRAGASTPCPPPTSRIGLARLRLEQVEHGRDGELAVVGGAAVADPAVVPGRDPLPARLAARAGGPPAHPPPARSSQGAKEGDGVHREGVDRAKPPLLERDTATRSPPRTDPG